MTRPLSDTAAIIAALLKSTLKPGEALMVLSIVKTMLESK